MGQINERESGLDYAKILAAIFIVAIHIGPFQDINKSLDYYIVYVIGRLAVPLFLTITGYFVFGYKLEDVKALKKFILHIIKLYIVSIILYLPVNIYQGIKEVSIINLIKAVLFDGTMYHLWYFPAVILGTLLVLLELKYMSLKNTFIINGLLYTIGALGDNYFGLFNDVPLMQKFYYVIFEISSYTRNGIFFTPLFLTLGYMLKKRTVLSKKRAVKLIFSIVLLLFEGWLIKTWGISRHSAMYFLIPVCIWYMFPLLFKFPPKPTKYLSDLAMYIYIYHVWVIVIVYKALRGTSIGSLGKYFLVLLTSFILSAVSIRIKLKFGEYRKSRKEKSNVQLHERRAWLEISLPVLEKNVEALQKELPEGCKFMAVVKANAYGMGSVMVSKYLNKIGINTFGVATMQEGIMLRKNHVQGTIVILGYTDPEKWELINRYKLIQTVVDYEYAERLNESGQAIHVNVKVDTGMNRLGIRHSETEKILKIFSFKNLVVEGIFTHLCVSDSTLTEDIEFTNMQLMRFRKVITILNENNHYPLIHFNSSYGCLNHYKIEGDTDYARIGLAMYGVWDKKSVISEMSPINLEPIFSLKARISVVKEIDIGETVSYGREYKAEKKQLIAGVTIGYADGIPRNIKNGKVLVNGKFALIIGRRCMDQLMIDVTDIPDVKQGDEVILLGKDIKNNEISVIEFSEWCATIPNEVLSRIGERVERVYIK